MPEEETPQLSGEIVRCDLHLQVLAQEWSVPDLREAVLMAIEKHGGILLDEGEEMPVTKIEIIEK